MNKNIGDLSVKKQLKWFIKQHRTPGNGNYYHVALLGEEVVGFASIKALKERNSLNFLYVAPQYRNKGIGKRLMKDILASMPNGSILEVDDYTGVYSRTLQLPRGRALYFFFPQRLTLGTSSFTVAERISVRHFRPEHLNNPNIPFPRDYQGKKYSSIMKSKKKHINPFVPIPITTYAIKKQSRSPSNSPRANQGISFYEFN